MPKKVKLTRAVSVEELKDRYRKEANPRVKERLLVLIHLCEGQSAVFTSQAVKCSKRSISRWVNAYNERGYEGLIPQFTGGPKPNLPDSVWDEPEPDAPPTPTHIYAEYRARHGKGIVDNIPGEAPSVKASRTPVIAPVATYLQPRDSSARNPSFLTAFTARFSMRAPSGPSARTSMRRSSTG